MTEKAGKKILVIEDNTVLGDILVKKLSDSGYVAELEVDGTSGLAKIKSWKPDLVLLDIVLPGLNGYEVLEDLNKNVKKEELPPIIIISNSGQPIEINRVLSLGVRDYVVKADFTPEDVLGKVAEQLGSTQTEAGEKMSGDFSVLVVEDDDFLRELLVRKLQQQKISVEVAHDGEKAVKVVDTTVYSMILLDLILPGINGFEVLEHIRKNSKNKETPVLVLSNLGQSDDIERAKELGATDFLIKAHFNIDEVVDKLKEYSK